MTHVLQTDHLEQPQRFGGRCAGGGGVHQQHLVVAMYLEHVAVKRP